MPCPYPFSCAWCWTDEYLELVFAPSTWDSGSSMKIDVGCSRGEFILPISSIFGLPSLRPMLLYSNRSASTTVSPPGDPLLARPITTSCTEMRRLRCALAARPHVQQRPLRIMHTNTQGGRDVPTATAAAVRDHWRCLAPCAFLLHGRGALRCNLTCTVLPYCTFCT
jgi:hypothetical protein